jgi:arsenite oxidase small subunit
MKRRRFVQVCAAGAAAAAFAVPTEGALTARGWRRAKLLDERRQPLRAEAIKPKTNYVFDYPFESTPCFLLRLDAPVAGGVDLRTESGEVYRWNGGIGPTRDIVAYSAICAHKMTYPTKQVSFIGYRDDPSPVAPRGKVITCCSDRSVYDPAAGARVVSGPAPQPLAAILLEQDPATGDLFAVGTFGADKFDEFFRKYDFRLQLEMGPRARNEVEGTATVRTLDNYSTQWAKC